jgi:hypothetical protein
VTERRIHEIKARLIRATERLAHHRRVVATETDRYIVGTSRYQLRNNTRMIASLQRELKQLEGSGMRKQLNEPASTPSMPPPSADFVLTVSKAGGLRFGNRLYRNGEQIDPSELARALNCDRIMQSGYVKWRPKASLFPQPKPSAKSPPAAQIPDDPDAPINSLLGVMDGIISKSGCSVQLAYERAVNHGDVVERYIRHLGLMKRELKTGGFGAGGGTVTVSGEGSYRRCTDGALEYILMRYWERKKERAA